MQDKLVCARRIWVEAGKGGDAENRYALAKSLVNHSEDIKFVTFVNGSVKECDSSGNVIGSLLPYADIQPSDDSLSGLGKRISPTGSKGDKKPDIVITFSDKHHHILRKICDDIFTVSFPSPAEPIPPHDASKEDYTDFRIHFEHQREAGREYDDTHHFFEQIPSRIHPSELPAAVDYWNRDYQVNHFIQERPVHTVLVGDISIEDAAALRDMLQDALLKAGDGKEYQGSILISASPRTKPEIKETLLDFKESPGDNPPVHHYLDFPTDSKTCNLAKKHYKGLLGLADTLIVTGDSMSMSSDAIATGKPTFVFRPSEVSNPLHTAYTDRLEMNDSVRTLSKGAPTSALSEHDDWHPQPSNSAADISQSILSAWNACLTLPPPHIQGGTAALGDGVPASPVYSAAR